MKSDKEFTVSDLAKKVHQLKLKQRASRTEPRGSRSKYLILSYLKTHNNVIPSELGKVMNVSTPRITTILNSLEEEGFINRHISTKDRRHINVTITDPGREYVINTQNKKLQDLEKLKSTLDESDFQAFGRILDTIHEIMEENTGWSL